MAWRLPWSSAPAIDLERVEAAVEAAERLTSGEIRVSVSRPFWGDVRRVAEKAFIRLGMDRTRERNAVLVFVVPGRRKFVVLGDTGIHARVGEQFWQDVAEAMSDRIRGGDLTGGIVEGVRVIGEQLATHFPPRPDDVDELPNRVDVGGNRDA